ncbi:two component transcriptional regulator, LuxR family [Streptomyces sp. yr375]|uniref:helix-turn-helix transcriptional regulator n=1 Tax=Streptomyces sp. yr375 TaxID=1761906 RepID=UPI0008BBF520|nr:LuxR C-terminal-related transcriptional regulator [Streptomyces sp. yr375]SER83922.1 two component transcriptional regulator, LuxR family [Streptomyces sp. yr375]
MAELARVDAVGVTLVGDHPVVLAGFESWYAASDPPIEVRAKGVRVATALAGPGRDAHVVVLALGQRNGTPAYGDLEQLAHSRRRVIVYDVEGSRHAALTCLDLGAFTYLTRAEGRRHLLQATYAAARGARYESPALSGPRGGRGLKRPRLSPREADVLLKWLQSESKAVVAECLWLSVRTVNTYLERVRVKYADVGRPATTKAQLLARAVQDGLISLDDL